MKLLLLGLLLLRSGDGISLNRDLNDGVKLWKTEAERRLDNPAVVFVHGEARHGRWYCFPDNSPRIPADVVAGAAKLAFYPRPVLFCSCNAHRLDLGVTGVYYAKTLVWVNPGPTEGRWATVNGMPLFLHGTGMVEDFSAE